MTKSVYSRIAQMKQTKYDKIVLEIQMKTKEIEALLEHKEELEKELEDLIANFPQRKKAVYDEYFEEGEVDRKVFEKIGYKIMVLEHEISAHKLKIKSHDEVIEQSKAELEKLEVSKQEFVKILEKYKILVEIDEKEQKRQAEFIEDAELEEFSKPKPRYKPK